MCSYARTGDVMRRLVSFLEGEGSLEAMEGPLAYASGDRDLPRSTGVGADVGSTLAENTPAELARAPVFVKLRSVMAETNSGKQHWDYLARHFGVFVTAAGRRRRVDVVVAAHLEWPFALLSWTGGKVFNRLLRNYANNMRCQLSAHGLMTVPRPGDDRPARIIPVETHPGTPRPETEEDVLRLLGIPWLPPHLRDV